MVISTLSISDTTTNLNVPSVVFKTSQFSYFLSKCHICELERREASRFHPGWGMHFCHRFPSSMLQTINLHHMHRFVSARIWFNVLHLKENFQSSNRQMIEWLSRWNFFVSFMNFILRSWKGHHILSISVILTFVFNRMSQIYVVNGLKVQVGKYR